MPNPWDSILVINDLEYVLDDEKEPAHQLKDVPVQDAKDAEFNQRIENYAMGHGHTKYAQPGTYDYALSALLHRRFAFLPGTTITSRSGSVTAPNGPTSFCEYWSATAANRRLIIVSPRYVYEVDANGGITTFDLNTLDANRFTTATGGALYGVQYKNAGMSASQVYLARRGATSTDHLITRTAANTYIKSLSAKYAAAIAPGKDQTGADVLWRIDENGRLNQCVADSDPEASGSWGAATYDVGQNSTLPVSLFQASKRLLVGKPDGVFSFDNVARSIPLTRGMEQTLDADNCKWPKDMNGPVIMPTVVGLIWVDGLQWGVCGPISSNREARSIAGREVAVSGVAGEYIYCAVYDGVTVSYIYQGTFRDNSGGSGTGPIVWHGPIASVSKQVTDLTVSTVYGKKLWLGYTDGFSSIDLNADFSPATDLSTGTIYFPEGILDRTSPAVLKEIHGFEYISPAVQPFSGSNQWLAEVNVGAGWVNAGAADFAVSYSRKTFSAEQSGRRPLLRLTYSGNVLNAELEALVVFGQERNRVRYHHVFNLKADQFSRKPSGARIWRDPQTVADDLQALRDTGWVGVMKWGETQVNGRVVAIDEKVASGGRRIKPTRLFKIEVEELP